jgi:hypothetical protein
VFNLPHGFELAPLFQAASSRPVDPWPATDINGDGRTDTDRVCEGSTLTNMIVTPGCTMMKPNSFRGFPFVQMDLSTAKNFQLGERANLRIFWEFHNLFNRFNKCNAVNNDANPADGVFLKPIAGPISGPYCAVDGGIYGVEGGGFGPGFSSPFRSQFGLRVRF